MKTALGREAEPGAVTQAALAVHSADVGPDNSLPLKRRLTALLQTARTEALVRVDKRDDRRRRHGSPGISAGSHTPALRISQHPQIGPADALAGPISRAIVDEDDLGRFCILTHRVDGAQHLIAFIVGGDNDADHRLLLAAR